MCSDVYSPMTLKIFTMWTDAGFLDLSMLAIRECADFLITFWTMSCLTAGKGWWEKINKFNKVILHAKLPMKETLGLYCM